MRLKLRIRQMRDQERRRRGLLRCLVASLLCLGASLLGLVTGSLCLGASLPCFASAVPSQPGGPTACGPSYWGDLPAPADSVISVFPQPPRPLWETTLLVPYKIVVLPISLLGLGLKESVIYLDESGTIYRLKKLIGPHQAPFGLAVRFTIGSIDGVGFGLTATHDSFLRPANQLKLRWSSTDRSAHKVSVGIMFREGSPTHAVLGASYRIRPSSRYYGIGWNTLESQESVYTQETSWVGFSLRHNLPQHLTADATLIYSGVGTRGPGDEGDVDIAERFPEPPVGYDDHSEGLTLSLGLIHDTTTEQGRPARGGIQRIKFSRFQQTRDLKSRYRSVPGAPALTDEGKVAFWTFRGDLEQFMPLWLTNRALALRAHLTWIEPDEGTVVPFQRLLTNDDPDQLRGFRDLRWRDRGLTGLSAEYRWPLWSNKDNVGLGVDSYLFTDVGQVFGEFSEISTHHLIVSYGWGLRLIGNRGFQGRFEMGWSDEEMVLRLSSGQVFQYAKGGLQHGRDQVALR